MNQGFDPHRQVRLSDEIVDLMWLRDACHCHICRDPNNNHRLLDIRDVPIDITAANFVLSRGVLHADFSDGHHGLIPWDMLEVYRTLSHEDRIDPFPQERNLGPHDALVRFSFERFSSGFQAINQACAALWRDGAILVHDVEATGYALRWVAEMLGNLYGTIHGDVWDAENGSGHFATFAPDQTVPPETDLPYSTIPPGVLMYLCVRPPVSGGEMVLVDGFAAAEQIRESEPDLFALLTSTSLAYNFHNNDVILSAAGPLVTIDSSGLYSMVRHAPRLAGSPRSRPSETREIFRSLRRWRDIVDETARAHPFEMEPGDLLVIDNHRVLHGRLPFQNASDQQRSMLACYVASDGMQSRIAMAELGYAFTSHPPGYVERHREIGDDAVDPTEPGDTPV